MKMYHFVVNILTASVPFVTILGSKTKIGYEHESGTRAEARHSEKDPLFAH